jgi:hypothetical protein
MADPQQDEIDRRRDRIVALLDQLAYPEGAVEGGPQAKRVDLAVLGSIGQAVWVTADSLRFVDDYYRPLLQLETGRKDIGVSSGPDGRWSYFHDGASFPAAGLVRPKGTIQTTRLMVGPFEGCLCIVLAVRPAGGTLTEISITVMPDDEDPQRG